VIPIHLDPTHLRIGLVGNGRLALKRYNWLISLNSKPNVWSVEPDESLRAALGGDLRPHLPTQADLQSLSVLWIADLEQPAAGELAARARAAKVVVNVEDDLPFCDFHTPAIVKRGSLVASIGTNGTSPAAAGFLRRLLSAALPAAWDDVLADLNKLRTSLRRTGATPRAVIAASYAYLDDPKIAAQIAPCGKVECPLVTSAHQVPKSS
jgi:precorrin-2 dehydrogenase / sirohydrochlorin ferrochelatase